MTIISNDPKYINLGRDMERVTDMMVFFNYVKNNQIIILRQTGILLEKEAYDYDAKDHKDQVALEHIKELKFIMNDCQSVIERCDTELSFYRDRYESLMGQVLSIRNPKKEDQL